ncbi:hypothetical protein E4U16_006903 [Claviceps sp. LM84 group G4]|nr:hypothetical protein E4U16_006903 [Claviceps sp. LM84 group G4]
MRFEDQLTGSIQQDYADAVVNLQAVADGVEAYGYPRDKAWAAKDTKVAYTTPIQRDTDGDIQTTGVNPTDFKSKNSETTGNAFAKAGTEAKRVSQEVVAGQLVERTSSFSFLPYLYQHHY